MLLHIHGPTTGTDKFMSAAKKSMMKRKEIIDLTSSVDYAVLIVISFGTVQECIFYVIDFIQNEPTIGILRRFGVDHGIYLEDAITLTFPVY